MACRGMSWDVAECRESPAGTTVQTRWIYVAECPTEPPVVSTMMENPTATHGIPREHAGTRGNTQEHAGKRGISPGRGLVPWEFPRDAVGYRRGNPWQAAGARGSLLGLMGVPAPREPAEACGI